MKRLIHNLLSAVFWTLVCLSEDLTTPLFGQTTSAVFGIDDLIIIALVLMVVSTIVSMALRPKAIPPMAAGLSDFKAPTAGEGRVIPEVIGTVRVQGPNVVWYGNPYTDPIPAPSGGSGS